MQLSVRILSTGPAGPEWGSRNYISSAQHLGDRPSLMVSMYPGECAAGLDQVIQALRWLMDQQPLVLAFKLTTDDGYTHEERRDEVAA